MSVHYKFKSTLDVDTIKFDGLHISVADLKRAIIQQKRLGKITDFDLQITNAQTREVYWEDTTLIPKNTSLIVARVPLVHHQKKSFDNQADAVPQQSRSSSKAEGSISVDIFKMKGSEEDKIAEMMMQSTADYDPNSYVKIKGQTQTGDVPATYRCNKCKKGGHWIKNCTFAGGKLNSDVKRNTGIPKSFLEKDDKAMENEMKDEAAIVATPPNSLPIPEELLCSICNDLFIDAVMIPCCGSSFCDDCVRSALLDSDENECPDCKEKGCSPASLIPNRFLRNSVNIFKTETGYKKASVKIVPKVNENVNVNKDQDTKPNVASNESSEPESKLVKPVVPAAAAAAPEQSECAKEEKKETTAATKGSMQSSHSTQTHNNTRSTNESKQVVPTMEEHHKNNAKKPTDSSRANVSKKPQDMYRGPDSMSSYQQIPTHTQMRQDHPPHCQPSQQVQFHSLYNEPRHIESIRYPNFNPMPYYHNSAAPYLSERHHHVDLMQVKPSENLSSIFQSVEQKVGTGIIDDPLEAFNRIMKEKERRRRRSPEISRQRSRNPERNSPRYSRRSMTRESRIHNYRKENVSRYAKPPSREKNNHRRRSNSLSDRGNRNSKSREARETREARDANKQGGSSKKRSISPQGVKKHDPHAEDKRFDHSGVPQRDSRKDPENSDATNRKVSAKESTPPPTFESAPTKVSNHDSKRASPMTPPLRFNQDCNGKEEVVEPRNKRPVSVLRDCKSPKAKIQKYSPSPDRKGSHWDHQSDKDSRTSVNQENAHKKSSQNGENAESLESDPLKVEHNTADQNDSGGEKKSKAGKKRRKEKDDRKKVKKHKRDKEKKVKDSSFTKKDEKRKSKDDCSSILKQSNENEADGEFPCPPQSDDKSGDHRLTSRQSSVNNDVGVAKVLDDELLYDRLSSDPFASKSDNPIFTRAINAIRSSDKPKSLPDVMDSSENSLCISSGRNTFEITVPIQDSKERSVKAVKSDCKDRHDSRKTTGMSIKDRLGTKRLSPYSKTASNERSSRRSRERTTDRHKSGSMSNKNEFSYKSNADKGFNSAVSEQNDRHAKKDATHNYARISSVCVENRAKRDSRERHKSYRHSKERDSSENRKDNSKNRKVRKSPKKKKDKKLKRRK